MRQNTYLNRIAEAPSAQVIVEQETTKTDGSAVFSWPAATAVMTRRTGKVNVPFYCLAAVIELTQFRSKVMTSRLTLVALS